MSRTLRRGASPKGFKPVLPCRYPIFPFFPPAETEQHCAQRHTNGNRKRDQRRREASFSHINLRSEPRASSPPRRCARTRCTASTGCMSGMVVYPGWYRVYLPERVKGALRTLKEAKRRLRTLGVYPSVIPGYSGFIPVLWEPPLCAGFKAGLWAIIHPFHCYFPVSLLVLAQKEACFP